MFSSKAFDGHEGVFFFSDVASGLRGIIAIHSTVLGPAVGGCRAWAYDSEDAALHDVLRLSRGMSFKNAVAGLPLGGGKAVIIRDPGKPVTEAQFEAFGRVVERLHGSYVTAEDVGVSVADMACVARKTSYVSGILSHGDTAGGDPAPKTAYGVYCGILAAVKVRLGRSDVAGLRVAVQGLGSVGSLLCENLHKAGARLVVSDINPSASDRIRDQFGAQVVPSDEILFQDVDVVSPCALGGILNAQSIPLLRAPIIAGGANNQLANPEDGFNLHSRGVLYAPDYVINAGGIICAASEYLRTGSEEEVWARVANIEHTLADIFFESARFGMPPHVIADDLARKRMAESEGPRH